VLISLLRYLNGALEFRLANAIRLFRLSCWGLKFLFSFRKEQHKKKVAAKLVKLQQNGSKFSLASSYRLKIAVPSLTPIRPVNSVVQYWYRWCTTNSIWWILYDGYYMMNTIYDEYYMMNTIWWILYDEYYMMNTIWWILYDEYYIWWILYDEYYMMNTIYDEYYMMNTIWWILYDECYMMNAIWLMLYD